MLLVRSIVISQIPGWAEIKGFCYRNKSCPHAYLSSSIKGSLESILIVFGSELLPPYLSSYYFLFKTKWEDNTCWPDFLYFNFLMVVLCVPFKLFSVHLNTALWTKCTSLASHHMQHFEKTCLIRTYFMKWFHHLKQMCKKK